MKFFILIVIVFFATGCNLLSIENISNDFKYKKDKFDKIEILKYRYKPFIVNEIDDQPIFYDIIGSKNLDSYYKIQSLLHKKFNKRNIKLESSDKFSVSIDSLLFKESDGPLISFYGSDNDKSLYGNKYYFKFVIIGTVKIKDSLIKVKVVKKHNSEPRESFVFPNVVANSGINANAKKMIENSISKFSYLVFKILEDE